jgi:omega-6 fatty acid desaturase (delta-12 desaturase)
MFIKFIFLLSSIASGFKISLRNKYIPSTILYSSVLADNKISTENMLFSTLEGKALRFGEFPTLLDIKSVLPKDTFVRSDRLSLYFALLDLATTTTCAFVGIKFILPLLINLITTPTTIVNLFTATVLWSIYSFITGTAAIGMWVTAHECGHGAFSDNRKLQDFIGYIYHSVFKPFPVYV